MRILYFISGALLASIIFANQPTPYTYEKEFDYFFAKYGQLDYNLNKIASREYTEDYRCLEFSEDLVRELREDGIQAEVVKGESPETESKDYGHAWVGIWFEPQSGKPTKEYTRW